MGMAIAYAISGLAMAGGQVASAKMAKSATREATTASTKANEEALAFEQAQEETRRQEWEQAQAENRRQYDLALQRERQTWLENVATSRRGESRDVEQWNAEQARRQPYRDVSWAAVQSLAKRAGLDVRPTQAPQLSLPPSAPTLAELAGYDLSTEAKG